MRLIELSVICFQLLASQLVKLWTINSKAQTSLLQVVFYSFKQFFCFTPRDIDPLPSLPENGSCVIYNGTICEKLLKGQPIFVRSYEKLENIEKKISIAYSRIQDYKKISKQCRPFVQPLLCHFNFPSCDKTSSVPTPRHICYEKCEFLRTDICKNEYLEARKASLQGVLLPECSTLPHKDSKQGKNCISKLKGNAQRNTKPVVGKNG